MAQTLDILQARDHAVRRLQASRGDLVRLLQAPPAGGTTAGAPLWRSARWFLRRWWRGHPMSEAANALEAVGRQQLAPMAARHPWALLGGAAVAGGVLAWAWPRQLQRWVLPFLAVEARRGVAALLAQALR
jgi:hypothetical protein